MSPTKRMLMVSIPLSTVFLSKHSSLPLLSLGALRIFASVLLLHLLLVFIYWGILYPKFFSPLRNIPQPPGASLILGHVRDIFKEPAGSAWRQWVDETPNDGMFKFLDIFSQEVLVVVSPAAIADVLVHKCYDFEKPRVVRHSIVRQLGDGILFAEGQVHKQQRKTLTPPFGFRHVRDLYPMFWDRSLRLIQTMKEQGERRDTDTDNSIVVEVSSWAGKATLSIIEEAALGVDLKAIEDPKEALGLTYRTLMFPGRIAIILSLLSIWLPAWLLWNIPTAFNHAIKKNTSLIREFCHAYIESPKHDTNVLPNTIIATAVESRQFSTPEIVEQMKLFLIAGHETTAMALTWAVYLLTQHPDMQTRLREEINTCAPLNTDGPISAADIDNLPYLHAFTSEVLRIYPPVPGTSREAIRPTSILSTPLPKGTIVVLLPWATNTSKKAWGADAREFNPDRWLNSPNGGAESNYSTLTFLHGPRSCIGERFARGEFACLLAAWVQAFETELEDPDKEVKVDITSGITVKPKGGLRVRLKPIER